MPSLPISESELLRLNSLCSYQILDTEPEAAFDDLTQLAAHLCNAPIALISLIDTERQWFKSKVGLEITETPRDIAVCNYAISQSEIFIVPDLLNDERFATNPSVIESPHIRFYAGVPLLSPKGRALGTLCVIDVVPRELCDSQISGLKALARQVMAQLELRRNLIESDKLLQEARHRQAALSESEERFRLIADSSPVLVWVDNLDKQSIFHNKAWLEFSGQPAEELQGNGWLKRVHPDDLERWSECYSHAFDAQIPFTVEYRLKRADGEYRWLLETGIPRFLADGALEGYTGSCVDITERKATEQGMQLLQSVIQAIVTSPDFFSALEISLKKVCEATQWEFGEAWVPNFGANVMESCSAWYSKTDNLQEFRQQSKNFQFAPGMGIPGRIWVSKQTEWHQDISEASSTTYLRTQLALKAGLKATLGIPLLANDEVVAVLVFYMFEAREEDKRMISLITASTELGLFIQNKRAEEEMRKLLLKEQELNRFKSNFLANISHELRTPLTSILGLSSLLLKTHLGTLNSKQEQYISVIHDSGEHLLNLINGLLDLAKIEAGKQDLFLEPIDVNVLCQNAIEMMQVRASIKQQTLSFISPTAIATIIADQQRILQILLNFLSNAIKFTPNEGTILLKSRVASSLEMHQETLAVETPAFVSDIPEDAQFLVLEVQDNGIGIPKEKQHLLFCSFQQMTTADYQCKGSGLGLTLSKQLAELHGGRVSFYSEVGHGSTFAVWLPIQTEEAP